MPSRTADFESAMYTNFITPAKGRDGAIIVAREHGRQPRGAWSWGGKNAFQADFQGV